MDILKSIPTLKIKRVASFLLAMILLAGCVCTLAEGAFDDYISQQNFLYGKDYTGHLEKADMDFSIHINHMPPDFIGELGYAIADLDLDGEKELLSVGTISSYDWDEYTDAYYNRIKLRIAVLEQNRGTVVECLVPMDAVSVALNGWEKDESENPPICHLLRVYVYGKKPRIMIESRDSEGLRGDGVGIDYTIFAYDGEELKLVDGNNYCGSDPMCFETEYVIGLAKNGIGCVNFDSVYDANGFIQTADDCIPVAGQITRTIISHDEYDSWKNADTDNNLDVSVTHVFSHEELNDGILKKRWFEPDEDWYTADENAEPWYEDISPFQDEWFTQDSMVKASSDSNIRSLPSLDGNVIGFLKKEEQLVYMDIDVEDDRGVRWHCVPVGNTYGWISEKYTELVEP